MVPKICSVDGCEKRLVARGWCNMHYKRWRKHGDPLELPPVLTLCERFWAKVQKSDACWIWTAAQNEHGYGVFGVGKAARLAHRVSFVLDGREIPDGLGLDHICRTRLCVRPSHLRPATDAQNRENHGGAQSNSKTGIRGVHWSGYHRKWKATVTSKGRDHHVGYFTDIRDAEDAAIAKRNELLKWNQIDRKKAA